MPLLPRQRIEVYGQLAFACLVLACYAQLTFIDLNRIRAEPGQLAAVFALGIAYTLLFLLSGKLCDSRPAWVRAAYYVTQCVLLTAAIFLSPSRGFFAMISVPLVGQAIFELNWRGAAAIAVWAFATSIAVFVVAYGGGSIWRSMVTYAPIFVFVMMFSAVAKEAIVAKEEAETLSRELAAANEKLRAHAAAAEELATTRERNRLAREIHDGVGHYLTVIKVQLDAAAALLPADPARAAGAVEKSARLAGEALDDVRRSVGALAADAARAPLIDTLRQLAADLTPVPVLQVEGTPRPLPAAAEHALYRTAQEGLTNVRKHAAATRATLTLDFRDPAHVRLILADNGRGLTAPAAAGGAAANGFGLRGLRERLALLGGSIVAQNRPEGGVALIAEVPA